MAPDIYVMVKPVSGLCNMRCDYCFYRDELSHRAQGPLGRMTEATLEQVIEKPLAFVRRECTFAWQGGEPTLAGLDFFRRAAALQKKYNINNVKIHNVLQTNGLCLDESWGRFFAEEKFLLGVSLDGTRAAHDAYRRSTEGGDTYVRVLDSIRLLERCGAEYNILTVVNSRTAPKIRRIYEQYKKLGFRYQQYIPCLDPLGDDSGKHGYSLTPQAYGQFLIDLFELWDIDRRKGEQPYIRLFENWLGILMGEQPEACEQRGVCGVQNIVESDGSVYPCDFYATDGYCLGSLCTDTMEQIYRRRMISGFIESSRNHGGECLSCPYFALCRGGCRRHREQGVNRFCAAYRLFFDRCLSRLAGGYAPFPYNGL